jgi:hypothetical protein
MVEPLDLSEHGDAVASSTVGKLLKQFPQYYVKNIFDKYSALGPKFQLGFHRKSGVHETDDGLFYGFINEDNERHGKGLLIKTDGSIQEAVFKKGQVMGQGRLITKDKRFDGNWIKEEMTEGLIVLNEEVLHSDSIKYQGEVRKRLPHGYGTLTEPGVTYEGSFENGEKVGRGIYRYEDGR